MGKLMLSKVKQIVSELELKCGSVGLPSHNLSTIPQFLFSRKRSKMWMTMVVNGQRSYKDDLLLACQHYSLCYFPERWQMYLQWTLAYPLRKQDCQYYDSMCLFSYRVLTTPHENLEETSSKFPVFFKYAPRPLHWFSSSTRHSWCHGLYSRTLLQKSQ